ncbi:hypothetical protein J6590_046999 [Homalodisca vitripennis]|nr:hypothetical protein J6590_046999 [Homalodisca vitripennis]
MDLLFTINHSLSLLVDSGIISRIISEVFVVGKGFGGCLGTICFGPRRVDDIAALGMGRWFCINGDGAPWSRRRRNAWGSPRMRTLMAARARRVNTQKPRIIMASAGTNLIDMGRAKLDASEGPRHPLCPPRRRPCFTRPQKTQFERLEKAMRRSIADTFLPAYRCWTPRKAEL